MASVSRRPTVLTAPAVVGFAASRAAFSPLDQLGLGIHQGDALIASSSASSSATADKSAAHPTPPIPTLDFNLFRSPSVYSVDSEYDSAASDYLDEGYGFGFVSEPEEGLDSDSTDGASSPPLVRPPPILTNMLQLQGAAVDAGSDDSKLSSPSTPRVCARLRGSGDSISAGDVTPSGSMESRTATPTPDLPISRKGSVHTRGPITYPSLPQLPYAPAALQSAVSESPFNLQPVPCRTSRSLSGPPVPDFETTRTAVSRSCSEPVPQPAPAAARPHHTTTIPDTASVHGEQGSDWGEVENTFEWVDTQGAPEASNGILRKASLLKLSPRRLSRLRNVIPLGPAAPDAPPVVGPSATAPVPRLKKKRTIVIPRRAAPPPPPDAPFVPTEAQLRSLSPTSKVRNTPTPEDAELLTPVHTEAKPLGPVATIPAGAPLRKGSAPMLRTSTNTSSTSTLPRRGSGGNTGPWDPEHNQHLSTRRGSGTRSASPTSSHNITSLNVNGRSTQDVVAAGIASREAGDYLKSTWLFMKAAEAGSITGKIHYGIALRHGLGGKRDERRGFVELQTACDRALAEGRIDLRTARASNILLQQQRMQLAPDTALGLVELGNCYLDGDGTKRSPDMALGYLRMAGSLGDLGAQEQLGHILAKGVSGIRKDLREAAQWYRAALSGGASIPGLAWVWKDKYNEA